jgi:hydrogenase/urease accessory protein HupE
MRLLRLSILVFILSGTALAHDPGLSAVEVHIHSDRIVAEVSFAPSDWERVRELETNLLIIEDDRQKLALRSFSLKPSDQNSVHLLLEFSKAKGNQLRITALSLAHLARGHKQFCSVYDQENRVIAERMLSAESNDVTINLRTSPANNTSFFRFLVVGIEHILTGYDHLAFLLALLLAGGTLRSNAKIITSFTVAHSLTLALATLGLVNISPSVVEPLIAVSVVFVGVENLIRRRFAARWLVTFGFGLVHGLGFASTLRDLGIGALGARAAIPLLSFNLGVELAQIAIAALVLPLVWRLEQRPAFTLRHVPALSLLITLAGVYWFVARTLI